jgi:hypothetical protein
MKVALGTFGELHKPTSKATKDERGDLQLKITFILLQDLVRRSRSEDASGPRRWQAFKGAGNVLPIAAAKFTDRGIATRSSKLTGQIFTSLWEASSPQKAEIPSQFAPRQGAGLCLALGLPLGNKAK